MALMAFSDSEVYNDKTCSKTCLKNYETLKKQCDDLIVKLNQTEFTTTTYKRGLATVEEQLITYRKNEVLFSKEVTVLKREVACKDYEINVFKNKLLESQITNKSKKDLGYSVVPPPHPLIYNRPKKLDLSYSGLDEFKEPEFKGYGFKDRKKESNVVCDKKSDDSKQNSDNSLVKEQVSKDTSSFVESSLNVDKETVFPVDKKGESKELEWGEVQSTRKVNYNYTTKRNHLNAQRNMVPRTVLMKTGLKAFNTIKTVNTAHPKSVVFSAKPMSYFSKTAQSTAQAVNTARPQAVNTARPKTVKTARPNSAVVNAIRVNQENDGKPQQDDTGFVDSGCSRHMTGNIAYLSYFKEFDGGYVTFGGEAHGGRISCKGLVLEKGIKREYSVARTPQQNGVAERRNRTLIEVARTMLADSKLPTTFWAEAVSTACYVQNRVLVVKPHNKTPYELFRGFKPALSFMRPFGCHVTILNTLDNLGKFDGKSDEGFFVGYSLSSKAFRVYNTRTRRVEENLHIGFLENKPMIEGNGPKWLFDIDSLTQSMNYVPVAAGTIINESAGTQEELNAGTSEEIKSICNGDANFPKEVNAAGQHVNTASPDVNTGSFKLNVVSPSVNTASSYDQDSPKDMFTMGASHTLEATHVEFFSDEDEPEVDLGNITNSYTVPTTPNTRIHKDHPIENVIGDVKSSVQTRRMTKPTSEQGFLSAVYEQKTHDTLNTYLYACFLSQIEPTSIAKALSDSSWVEAMQEELLQFKLQQVWILMDLPIGKRAIRTKWVFRNKKDEKGDCD
ncbi:putative ribonuclease H-like domain-containing protein [Tanacetum coccineum]